MWPGLRIFLASRVSLTGRITTISLRNERHLAIRQLLDKPVHTASPADGAAGLHVLQEQKEKKEEKKQTNQYSPVGQANGGMIMIACCFYQFLLVLQFHQFLILSTPRFRKNRAT